MVGANDRRIIQKHAKKADMIIALCEDYKKLSDDALRAKTTEFKQRLAAGSTLDDILVEAFSVARESARRLLNLEAYRVQIIGAIVLHEGDVAEMKTGEGKTLTALMPTYLNALTGKGVHIVTVNEYLSERDSEINGKVLSFLGLTVGLNKRQSNRNQKQAAYAADVTYTTNAELGFDYLRDNMVKRYSDKVQRGLNYCIVDEADSVLIDEARTPLIISGGRNPRVPQYAAADQFAKGLKLNEDVEVDLETKQVYLTAKGVKDAEAFFSIKALFNIGNTEIYHLILNALKANFIFKNGVEYIVQDNQIVLVDQHTGRLMPGRSYSDGLQQSIQAKENVEIEQETVTMATITYQNFFRLYNRIAGMTGTAKTEEEEFIKIYNMRVICIPTNKTVIRKDETDLMFARRDAKMKALMAEVEKLHAKGQPILIGTTSVESSEIVSHYLKKANLAFEMLNAKNHEREADIIAKAGVKYAITLATNMAGRGTDIKLGPGVAEIGGLAVLGVDRNDARRIDNQLRGRSGRQGDPGFSRFYVAVDDDLMVRFGGERLKKMFTRLGDDFIRSRMLMRSITNAQKKVEGMNFDQRKNILDYDNVLSQHREAIYAQRDQILRGENLSAIIKRMHYTVAYDLTRIFGYELHGEWFVDMDKLLKGIEDKIIFANKIDPVTFKNETRSTIAAAIAKEITAFYEFRMTDVAADVRTQIEQHTILSALDKNWQGHIDATQKLRSGIYLRSYAQTNPLHAYVQESKELYDYMKTQVAHEVIINLANVVLRVDRPIVPLHDEEQLEVKIKG